MKGQGGFEAGWAKSGMLAGLLVCTAVLAFAGTSGASTGNVLFSDDFASGALSQWTIATGPWAVVDGTLRVTASSCDCGPGEPFIGTTMTFDPPFRLDYDMAYLTDAGGFAGRYGGVFFSDTVAHRQTPGIYGYMAAHAANHWKGYRFQQTVNGNVIDNSGTLPGPSYGIGDWHHWTLDVERDRLRLMVDGVAVGQQLVSQGPGPLHVVFFTGTGGGVTAFDNVVVSHPLELLPRLTVPSDLLVEAEGVEGAWLAYEATAADPDGTLPVACAPASPAQFPLNTTLVTCEAWSRSGYRAEASFNVTVLDRTPPTLQVKDIVQEADRPEGAPALFALQATDQVDPDPEILCTRDGLPVESGDVFPFGESTVACVPTDFSGNAGDAATFRVKVVDRTPPALVVPWIIVVEATGPAGATAEFDVAATDLGQPLLVYCLYSSGVAFPLGRTMNACVAFDRHGNLGSAAFPVVVQDTTPPKLNLSLTGPVEADRPEGSSVEYLAHASDIVDGPVTPHCAPPSGATFPIGTTIVRCIAVDRHGNAVAVEGEVHVVDTTPPEMAFEGVSPAPNAEGWHRSAVAVAWRCVDVATGPLESEVIVIVPPEGRALTATAQCADQASPTNTNTSTYGVLNIDITAPSLNVPLEGLEGAAGWWRSNVTMSVACVDALSGNATPMYRVDSDVEAPYQEPFLVEGDGSHLIAVRCDDLAGNVAGQELDVRIDTIAPEGAIEVPRLAADSFAVKWSAADRGSRLARIEVQEQDVHGEWIVACSFDVEAVEDAAGLCLRDVKTGYYCYRVQVTDVAGNTNLHHAIGLGLRAGGPGEGQDACTLVARLPRQATAERQGPLEVPVARRS